MVTHEYTLLLGGTIITGGSRPDAAAIAWASDTVLALGSEMEVRSISRGDSHVVEIQGRFVVPLAPGADVEMAHRCDPGAGWPGGPRGARS